mmetsp:Transcript_627/g.1812  ORF Transcript_627/g.1812 Transcript_627/m.1812 type:complete len:229 (+) Transcript_627:148-834(+)
MRPTGTGADSLATSACWAFSRILLWSPMWVFRAENRSFVFFPNPNSSKSASSCAKCSERHCSRAFKSPMDFDSASVRKAAAHSPCSASIEGTFTETRSNDAFTNSLSSTQSPLVPQPPLLQSPFVPQPPLSQSPFTSQHPPRLAWPGSSSSSSSTLLTAVDATCIILPLRGPAMKPKSIFVPLTATHMPVAPRRSGLSGGGSTNCRVSPGQNFGSGWCAQTASSRAST